MKTKIVVIFMSVLFLANCSSTSSLSGPTRKVIDSSARGEEAPKWVNTSKLSWEEGNAFYFKGFTSFRGNERVSSCFEVSKLEAKKNLLSEIKESIKSILDISTQSASEDQEQLYSQAVSSTLEGEIRGLRFMEQYFERYLIEDRERVDCFVMGAIEGKDYQDLKRRVLHKLEAADPRIKEALMKKQTDFFSTTQAQTKEGQ
jgi:hypothetical protein